MKNSLFKYKRLEKATNDYFISQYRKVPFRTIPEDIRIVQSGEEADKLIGILNKGPKGHVNDPDDF